MWRNLGEQRYEESLALCQLPSFMVNGTIHRKYGRYKPLKPNKTLSTLFLHNWRNDLMIQFIEPTLQLKTCSPCWFHFTNQKEYTSRVKWITVVRKLSLIAPKIFQPRNQKPGKGPYICTIEVYQSSGSHPSDGCQHRLWWSWNSHSTTYSLVTFTKLLNSMCLHFLSIKWRENNCTHSLELGEI